MGLISYLKPAKDGKKAPPAALSLASSTSIALISSPGLSTSTSSSGLSSLSSQARWNFMADYLRLQQVSRQWTDGVDQGVVMKRSRGDYICSPPDLALADDGFMKAVEMLNVQVNSHGLWIDRLLTRISGRDDRQFAGHQTLHWS
jgi:hypothetical protein